MWADSAPYPTFEGVNVIMYQQSSRMLLKQSAKIASGKPVNEFFSYLSDVKTLLSSKSQAKTVAEFLEPDHLQQALAVRACFILKRVSEKLAASEAPSMTKQNDLFAIDVNRMTRLHLVCIMYERARKRLASKQMKDRNGHNLFMTVLANFALNFLREDSSLLFESGFFGAGSGELLE